jgi:hypothetical protein
MTSANHILLAQALAYSGPPSPSILVSILPLLILFGVIYLLFNSTAPLVIKDWKASNQPVDTEGNFVRIIGRAAGVISWLLALIKIDPTTTLLISASRVRFSSASFSGTQTRIIPVFNISSTSFGFHKPWKSALVIFGLLLFVNGMFTGFVRSDMHFVMGAFLGYFGFMVATALAILYYFLGRTLTLGIVEHSGVVTQIRFKRSVIENVALDEQQARYVSDITQFLIEASKQPSP